MLTKKNRAIHWPTDTFEVRATSIFGDHDKYSETFRKEMWIRENLNTPFSLDMPFIKKGGLTTSNEQLRNELELYQSKNRRPFKITPCEIGPFNDWREPVRLLWNDWAENGYSWKKPQLLLIGSKTNLGKTTFVRQVLFKEADPENAIPSNAILIPEIPGSKTNISAFAWQNANPAFHSVIFRDEFDPEYFNIELLKIVIQGDAFNPMRKGKKSGNDICLKIPAIFISNKQIPDRIGDKDLTSLKSRFFIIKIPDNARQYPRENPYNPYIEMYAMLHKNNEETKYKLDQTSVKALQLSSEQNSGAIYLPENVKESKIISKNSTNVKKLVKSISLLKYY